MTKSTFKYSFRDSEEQEFAGLAEWDQEITDMLVKRQILSDADYRIEIWLDNTDWLIAERNHYVGQFTCPVCQEKVNPQILWAIPGVTVGDAEDADLQPYCTALCAQKDFEARGGVLHMEIELPDGCFVEEGK
jgi:hypothetical protein